MDVELVANGISKVIQPDIASFATEYCDRSTMGSVHVPSDDEKRLGSFMLSSLQPDWVH